MQEFDDVHSTASHSVSTIWVHFSLCSTYFTILLLKLFTLRLTCTASAMTRHGLGTISRT
jgi:hypothetical protein